MQRATVPFTSPIISEEDFDEFIKKDRAIVFHISNQVDPGYRRIRREAVEIVDYCNEQSREYYRILDSSLCHLLDKCRKKDVEKRIQYGAAFFKKGKLLLETEGMDLKRFVEACAMFDKMSPDGELDAGCCSGCTVM
ncbi:hypothetical protein LPJ56_003971 [Coemansia sp. RSA 2599]|nr:hypothetical protein LPJ75_003764 [Coemansia sp. RSA 2598]KAJ1817834.1 hypothetical protein LPJ56_003971 [Coemansia sp. RSA 2599]